MASKYGRWVFGALALGAAMAAPRVADAALVGFCDFSNQGQIQGFQTNGDAQFVGGIPQGSVLNLTPNGVGSNGSAYLKTPVSLTASSNFSTHFRFRMYPNAGTTGGTGITFTLQNKAVTALGGSGAGLAINGVGPAVSFEFDAKKDTNTDADDNHVAVIIDGKTSQHIQQTPVPFPMKNGTITDVWIDYTSADHTAKVYMAQSGPKPLLPVMSAVVNIYDAVDALGAGNKVWAGFSGSADQQSSNNQDVSYWVFANDGTPLTDCVPCLNDTQCIVVPQTPACDSNTGFCVECTATNDDACKGTTPVCDPGTNRCVECNTSNDCAGFESKPICSNHICVPCDGDYPNASPPACFLPTKPACQTPPDGVLQAGSCTECSSRNDTLCVERRPVCILATGTCGCNADNDCATAGTICVQGNCDNGCRPDGSVTCPNGGNCVADPNGQTGHCVTGCDPGNPNACQGTPTPICNCPGGGATCVCVQCQTNTDCTDPANPICSPANTCVACTPSNTTNCDVNGTGGACKPNGQCGCVNDADCGGLESGRVCDDVQKSCRAGCRGISGNRCPAGLRCTSTTNAIGQCVTDPNADGGVDAGPDGSVDAGTTDGGPKPDSGSSSSSSSSSGGAGDAGAIDDISIEGGGCNCNVMPAGGALPAGALGFATLGLLALMRRRERRK